MNRIWLNCLLHFESPFDLFDSFHFIIMCYIQIFEMVFGHNWKCQTVRFYLCVFLFISYCFSEVCESFLELKRYSICCNQQKVAKSIIFSFFLLFIILLLLRIQPTCSYLLLWHVMLVDQSKHGSLWWITMINMTLTEQKNRSVICFVLFGVDDDK